MAANNGWVAHLRHYNLKELRRRQGLTKQQIAIAYKANNTRALTELQTMADSLTETVLLNEFGE